MWKNKPFLFKYNAKNWGILLDDAGLTSCYKKSWFSINGSSPKIFDKTFKINTPPCEVTFLWHLIQFVIDSFRQPY